MNYIILLKSLEPDKPVKAHKDLIKIREKKMDSIMGV